MRMSPAGVELLKSFEGCKLSAYQDVVGVWTIGFGSTKGVKAGDVIDAHEANRRLREDDLPVYEKTVSDISGPIGTAPVPTQDQFDAMVSLCYNIGPGAFQKSTVARRFRQGDINGAADAFLMWNKASGKVVAGLTRRRQIEKAYFLGANI